MAAPIVIVMQWQEFNEALVRGFRAFTHLKQVHARLLRFELHQDHYLLNMVLKSAFNFCRPDYTIAVFGQTLRPNFYLYNTMIRGLVSNDCFSQAIEYFYMMRKQGFLPNNFTFPFVLKSCSRRMDLGLGVKVHSLVVKAGFDTDVFVSTGLVGFYSKLERLDDALKVFVEIPEKNVVTWTALIGGYIGAHRFREAIHLFQSSVTTDLRPDSFTLVQILSCCSHLGDLSAGQWIHNFIIERKTARNVFVNTALVDMYAKCGGMESARLVFDEMPEKDIVTWGTMVQGYASNGFPKQALEIFSRMQEQNLRPDCYVIVGVLSSCARLGALQLGESAFEMMGKNEFLSNPVMGTALIDMYSKCGKMDAAMDLFRQMKALDLVILNAVISGLAMTGHVHAAFSCFALLEKKGFEPDGNTFLGLLCGCTHAGLVRDGRRFFSLMSSRYFTPVTIEHYGAMADLLSRAGLLNEAQQLIESMPVKANAIVWGALLNGCRLHRDTKLAESVLRRLIEVEPENSANYVLLSNIYSANKKWEESETTRSIMATRGIQKVKACSWIEVNGVVHEFLVGDRTHPATESIYAKVFEIEKEMREAGYVPTTELVHFDVEEEEKEQSLGYHSEKLALAFGLLTTTTTTATIRIAKNLRVCGDCHAAFKLVSRLTGREIIVRDTNRFHHFSEGKCSCGDYW
ncbi:hypothetical protein M569_11327 [Genlisea aurea]|uniref:DYW domain-containing protein n=1 Tax=Genlisea aurea TaxID=192259 RepID=S8C9J3_9LAMI|nr:hypothetical protein M569_11327 [Genlisea aurea]